MAQEDEKEKRDRMTSDELSLYKFASSVASEARAVQEARADFSASDTALQPAVETEKTAEPEISALYLLSDIIIQRYEGTSGDLSHREGVAYFKGGHVYKGNFVDGFMHGPGEYTWAHGVKYKGNFESNTLMGHGTYRWLDRSTYEGEVSNGLRHGTGTYKSVKTGTVYRGQWHKGQRHGKGTMYYNEDETSWYKGDWENNQRQGWGMRCYSSGDTYEGQWKNNVRHGEGTMKWVQLCQQYSGQWLNGVQNGQGKHTWFVMRILGTRYPLRNKYKGEFAQGLRHGQGTYAYATGAVYSGGWKNNIKHGQGKYIYMNGQIYEGEFLNDNIAEFPASCAVSSCAPCGLNYIEILPDMALSIEALLNRFPEAHREQELSEVEFVILRYISLLRHLYSVYSIIGHESSPDNIFVYTRLKYWRFLKDCRVHHHGLTLAQLVHLIDKDAFPGEVHSPFSTMLLRNWMSCNVIAAYHIYHRDFESSRYVIGECFSKLMNQNVIPNAKNVRGPLYCHPRRAVISSNYINRCWEIYQTAPKVISADLSDILTARHVIWMFKVLGLFDCTLTTRRLVEILSQDDPAIYSSTHSNLDLEITFLEFFEALLVCAEVKNTHRVGTAQHGQCELSYPDQTSSRAQIPISSQLASPEQYESTVLSSSTISSSATNVKSLEEFKSKATPQSSMTEEMQCKGQGTDLSKLAVTNTSEMELNKQTTSSGLVEDTQGTRQSCRNTDVAANGQPEEQLEIWSNCIHQFFSHTFFPAYEHNLVRTKEIQEEHQRQTTENRITLEKAKAIAKLREPQRAEEKRSKEKEETSKDKLEEGEEGSHVSGGLKNSSAALTTPVTSSNSLDLKQSLTSKKKKEDMTAKSFKKKKSFF